MTKVTVVSTLALESDSKEWLLVVGCWLLACQQTTNNNQQITIDRQLMTSYTLGDIFERSGVGLHSGILTKVRVLPAAAGEGRYFVRVDLPSAPIVPARVEAVQETILSTELGTPLKDEPNAIAPASFRSDARVRTVEHLLAALTCSGVDDARIEIDGPEVPLLDGSAQVWVEAIHQVGIVVQGDGEEDTGRSRRGDAGKEDGALTQGREDDFNVSTILCASPRLPLPASSFVLKEPIWVYQGDAFVAALPSPTTRFTYGIDFDLAAIGNQWHSWTPEKESFAQEIAPARTFGLAHQIEALRDRGLIKGGSLENALVCDESGWLNPPLRFSNEPVRHKLLDLVGDLSLLGTYPVAHFLAYKASHHLHIQLAKKLVQHMVEG
jgi:UDP-3-O-[3-hydroxymyristoyl] N-acetylglucosamine deacetylase